jgi:hypothetical protein
VTGEYSELQLGGTLSVALADLGSGMYVPTAGDVFSILYTDGSRFGTFDNEQLPDLGGGLFFDVQYGLNAVRLAVLGVPGDYNYDSAVDAADYVTWRKRLGQSGPGLAADGNADQVVDNWDYGIWRSHFGQTTGSGAVATADVPSGGVPEPMSVALLILAAACLSLPRGRVAAKNGG